MFFLRTVAETRVGFVKETVGVTVGHGNSPTRATHGWKTTPRGSELQAKTVGGGGTANGAVVGRDSRCAGVAVVRCEDEEEDAGMGVYLIYLFI